MIFADAQSDIQTLHNNAQALIAQSTALHQRVATATGLNAVLLKAQEVVLNKQVAAAVAAEAIAITAATKAGATPAITPTIIPAALPIAADVGISGQTIFLVAAAALAAWFGIKKLREKN